MVVFSRVLFLLSIALIVTTLSCSEAETKAPPATSPPKPVPTRPVDPEPTTPPPAAEKPAEETTEGDPAALAERGSAVYTANCIACHNTDPAIDGAIGPAVAGASLELLEARIMHNTYPEGYTPKRDTKAMIPLPYLEKDLPALAAFLAE